jgi:MFS family permease
VFISLREVTDVNITRVSYGYFAAALLDLLVGGVVFAFPYMAQSINAGTMGTISNTLFSISYVATCFFLSQVRLVKDYRILMTAGSILFGAGCLILRFDISHQSLLYAPCVMAAGSAMFYPAIQAWFTEGLDRPTTVKVMGGYSIAWVVGYLLGPPIVGLILSERNFTHLLLSQKMELILSIFTGTAFLLALTFLPFRFKHQEAMPASDASDSLHSADAGRIGIFLVILWIANFVTFFLGGTVRFIFTELAKVEQIDSFIAGNVNVAMFLCVIVVSFFLRSTRFWILRFRYLIIVQILAIPALLFFALQSSIAFYFTGAVIFGLITGFTYVSSASYSLLAPAPAGKNIGINEAILGSGAFFSGLIGYAVSKTFTVKQSFLPGILLVLMAIAMEILIYMRWKKGRT